MFIFIPFGEVYEQILHDGCKLYAQVHVYSYTNVNIVMLFVIYLYTFAGYV